MTILLFINDKHGLHFVRLHLDRKRSAFVRHERVKQLLIEIRAKDAQERLVPLKYRRRRLWRRVLTLHTAKAMGFLGRWRPHPFLVRTTPKFRGVSSPRPIGLGCTPMGGAPVTSALG